MGAMESDGNAKEVHNVCYRAVGMVCMVYEAGSSGRWVHVWVDVRIRIEACVRDIGRCFN